LEWPDYSFAAQLPRNEKAVVSLHAESDETQPGSALEVTAYLTIEDEWHTNSNQPTFPYLIATEAEVTLPEGWTQQDLQYPAGEMKTFAFADQPLSVYEGEIGISVVAEVPPSASGVYPISVDLTYQACDDRSCLAPVTARDSIEVEVISGSDSPRGVALPLTNESVETRAASAASGLGLILLLGWLGGLILNAMPCVLPIVSLKVFGLVKSAGQGRAAVTAGALATSLGILISFWLLALAAVLAKTAGAAVGWGIQFQNPTFVVFLSVIVVLFALNLWGTFEIALPQVASRFASSGPREGIAGHLASGFFATLMATPCSAPFLGPAMGFALSQQTPTILAVFTAVGLGMATPYFILAAVPASARFLPKPGQWMNTFRVAMGFLLVGALIWLLYVLSSQVSSENLALIEVALTALCFFVWLRHNSTEGKWKRIVALLGIFAMIALPIMVAAQNGESPDAPSAVDASQLIRWIEFDRSRAEGLVAEGRLVFVDVTADWCFTCKVNERLVLETEAVSAAFKRYDVIPMKADWTNPDDSIAQFLADHGRYGIPFYLLYRPGTSPHLFSELLNKEDLISVLEQASN
jgi:suppressor for copper-sensitivity B